MSQYTISAHCIAGILFPIQRSQTGECIVGMHGAVYSFITSGGSSIERIQTQTVQVDLRRDTHKVLQGKFFPLLNFCQAQSQHQLCWTEFSFNVDFPQRPTHLNDTRESTKTYLDWKFKFYVHTKKFC